MNTEQLEEIVTDTLDYSGNFEAVLSFLTDATTALLNEHAPYLNKKYQQQSMLHGLIQNIVNFGRKDEKLRENGGPLNMIQMKQKH